MNFRYDILNLTSDDLNLTYDDLNWNYNILTLVVTDLICCVTIEIDL